VDEEAFVRVLSSSISATFCFFSGGVEELITKSGSKYKGLKARSLGSIGRAG